GPVAQGAGAGGRRLARGGGALQRARGVHLRVAPRHPTPRLAAGDALWSSRRGRPIGAVGIATPAGARDRVRGSTGVGDDDGARTPEPRPRALARVGTVSRGARLGDGARGLQRRRHSVGLLPARPRALARVSLERGRPRRDLRSPPAPLLRARALERTGSDPEGAPFRGLRSGGQPRRGREGVLLVPRLDPDALVHADALQVSAGGIPLRRPRRYEPPPRQARARVRADRHRGVRGRSLLRRLRRVREGGRGRRRRADPRREPRPGGRGAPPAADPLVPEQLVVVARARPAAAPPLAARPARDRRGARNARTL